MTARKRSALSRVLNNVGLQLLSFYSGVFTRSAQILIQMLLCVCQSCSQSFPCAGRAVRNAFLSHGVCVCSNRRSYVGVELVQWLCEQCVYVRCRTTGVRVWQVLLELGVLLSVDQRVMFSDSNSYYQFSFEECDSASCDFRSNEGEWPEAVRLLLQLAPYIHLTMKRCPEDSEGNRDICSEMLQMKALERLTSTVQNELAAALARKTRKSTDTSQQEPQTPSEESSPVIHTHTHTHTCMETHYNKYRLHKAYKPDPSLSVRSRFPE
uniref:DEP domain-containing protein n=1 Tax=Gasterosteus aculeatus aculeatus TaxID=481459 RepID=A0AAQ4QE53_GASAC